MMLMRKNFPIFPLMVVIALFIGIESLYAADVPGWQLNLRDDGSLQETITLTANPQISGAGWKFQQQGDNWIGERTAKNWQVYQAQSERIPLEVETKNYLIWQNIIIKKDNVNRPTAEMLAPLLADKNSTISFRVPGIIQESSGKQIGEDRVEFNLTAFMAISDGKTLLHVTTFDGLVMGITLFVLGFLVVVIIFMNRIRKVNRLIDEEYSLEKAAQQLEIEETGVLPEEDQEKQDD